MGNFAPAGRMSFNTLLVGLACMGLIQLPVPVTAGLRGGTGFLGPLAPRETRRTVGAYDDLGQADTPAIEADLLLPDTNEEAERMWEQEMDDDEDDAAHSTTRVPQQAAATGKVSQVSPAGGSTATTSATWESYFSKVSAAGTAAPNHTTWGSYFRSLLGAVTRRDGGVASSKKNPVNAKRPVSAKKEEEGDDDEDDEDEEQDDEMKNIRKAGSLADSDGDNRLSTEELLQFAMQVRERRRQKMTKQTLKARDTDRDGKISRKEAEKLVRKGGGSLGQHVWRKFDAADANSDGQLDAEELHGYVHPETSPAVLDLEVSTQFGSADQDSDGKITLQEFLAEVRKVDKASDFSSEDVSADFVAHDADKSESLDKAEFTDYILGHVLLRRHAEQAMQAGDKDADGHIHLAEELPHRREELLDSEFVEDYLIHHRRNDEL